MNQTIDLNADVGEGLPTDAALMPFISSANIACGFHAGDKDIMRRTVELCLKHGVAVGAHPSFNDREHFGRREMTLPLIEIASLMREQLEMMLEVCREMGAHLHHVKPHGALYNMSAHHREVAQCIAEEVYRFNSSLFLYGLSGSHSIAEGVMAGLQTVAEVFADRTYQEDGSLTPRSQANALIQNAQEAIDQAMMLVTDQQVRTLHATTIEMMAESVCLHGDGPHAIDFARLIHETFLSRGITIQAP